MLLDAVYAELQMTYGNRPASLREGQFLVNNETARMFNVLFDSGALHHSYISASVLACRLHRLLCEGSPLVQAGPITMDLRIMFFVIGVSLFFFSLWRQKYNTTLRYHKPDAQLQLQNKVIKRLQDEIRDLKRCVKETSDECVRAQEEVSHWKKRYLYLEDVIKKGGGV